MTEPRRKNSSKGRLWNIDENGFLKNDADFKKIQPEFSQVVEETKIAFLEQLLPFIHSHYLTGSIPRGVAIPGVSDLDTFAILKKSSDIPNPDFSKIKSDLLNRHGEVTDIQMELWEWQDLFGRPKEFVSEHQVILKLNSACLYGEDLSCEIPPIKPDVVLANTEVIQLKNDVEQVLREIAKNPSPSSVQYWCKRIMKNIIRAGFYMVIPSTGVFTRDLALCTEHFLNHFSKMEGIRDCRKYIEQPMSDASDLEYFLKRGFGDQLLAETKKWLDTYNPERHQFLRRISQT